MAKLELQTALESEVITNNLSKYFRDETEIHAFKSNLLDIARSNSDLLECEPYTLINSAINATKMKLSINPLLGQAYVIPYRNRKKNIVEAQFQIGYKGWMELLYKTQNVKRLKATTVFEGQLIKNDPLRGYEFDWDAKESDKVVGYIALLQLMNGYDVDFFMTIEEMRQHAKSYSATYRKGFGVWKDSFEAMAHKTVIKMLISKYAPKTEGIMSQALTLDQSIIRNMDGTEYEYVDNKKPNEEEMRAEQVRNRIKGFIENAESKEELSQLNTEVYASEDQELISLFENRLKEFGEEVI